MAGYGLALVLGVIGLTGCCCDQPIAKYGPPPEPEKTEPKKNDQKNKEQKNNDPEPIYGIVPPLKDS